MALTVFRLVSLVSTKMISAIRNFIGQCAAALNTLFTPASTVQVMVAVRFSHRLTLVSAGIFLLAGFGDARTPVGNLDNGPAAYALYCASCHGKTLGGGFGPPLVGKRFRHKWADAQAGALDSFIRKTMPPASPGGLSEAQYAAVEDVISAANSLPPGAPVTLHPENEISNPMEVGSSDEVGTELGLGPDHRAESVTLQRRNLVRKTGPVTDSLLQNPPDGDWLSWRRTLDALGYSPLRQIHSSNVRRLTLAWSRSLTPGTNGIAPLVHNGVMYLNASGKVLALNAATGEALWEFAGKSDAIPSMRVPLSQPRTIALYADKVYVPTLNGHVLALDAHSGTPVWDHEIFAPHDELELTSGPLVIHGKVIQGVAGCIRDYRGGCYIVALNSETGREEWRVNTIARPGHPGGSSWNGADLEDRYGASVWITGSYDPELNLVYFGTGQTYKVTTLLLPNAHRGDSSDALFTDSTLAIDPDSGRLVWYYQHLAGDVWDLDWAYERTLMTLKGPTGPKRVVVTGGKPAIFDALDAKTGKYLFSIDLGLQNLVQSIDPHTGAKKINPAARFGPGHSSVVCPYGAGARNWPSTSYDPQTGFLFVPMVEDCMEIRLVQDNAADKGWRDEMEQIRRPDSDGNVGRLTAIDLQGRRLAWTNRRRAPQSSATLATAGGLVFEGSSDRSFRALDSRTGEKLWETSLNDTPNSYPISFSVVNTQYVAIITGGGAPFDVQHRSLTPEIEPASGARTLWVFSLGPT